MAPKVTIVNYYGSQDDSSCGYCSTTNSSQSHGMWAHCMRADDYQDLIDRGWRRSGQYCYKPNNKFTCCPSYTIKCDARAFILSKSHKKILKRMNNFLRTGKKSDNTSQMDADQKNEEDNKADNAIDTNVSNASNEPKAMIDMNHEIDESKSVNTSESDVALRFPSNEVNNSTKTKGCDKINIPDPTKPVQQKAKVIRRQRKFEKQLNSANSSTEIFADSSQKIMPWKKVQENSEQTLQSLINAMPTDAKHKLEIRLVPSQAGSTEAVLSLYRRYQVGVHKDSPEKITRKSFESFLVRTPLIANTPENGPDCGYGSFHQQYWLDDKLIAVGVIDILPKCISSVYFFYDPDYSFLSLGTYGTLHEIQFTQELNAKCPALSEYYMGFYIHSCSKMRYKGKLQPSYLLCSEAYTWHLINDDMLRVLDISKYSRFNVDPNVKDIDEFLPSDLDNLRLLVDFKYGLTYKEYREYNGRAGNNSDDEDYENHLEYGRLVGKSLSQRLFLVT